jgi:hypothetical protein
VCVKTGIIRIVIVAFVLIGLSSCARTSNLNINYSKRIFSISISDNWIPSEGGGWDSTSIEVTGEDNIKDCLNLINSIKIYSTKATEAIERSPAVSILMWDKKDNTIKTITIYDGDKLEYGWCWYEIDKSELNKIHAFCKKYGENQQ